MCDINHILNQSQRQLSDREDKIHKQELRKSQLCMKWQVYLLTFIFSLIIHKRKRNH